MIPSIPDQASSIRCHCIFFLPIYKGWRCLYIACSAYAPQLPCHFFCPQSVKERFLGASVSESECKGTTFFRFRKNFDDYFSRKCKKYWKTGEKGRVLREFRAIKGRRAIRTNGILQAIRPARKKRNFQENTEKLRATGTLGALWRLWILRLFWLSWNFWPSPQKLQLYSQKF